MLQQKWYLIHAIELGARTFIASIDRYDYEHWIVEEENMLQQPQNEQMTTSNNTYPFKTTNEINKLIWEMRHWTFFKRFFFLGHHSILSSMCEH